MIINNNNAWTTAQTKPQETVKEQVNDRFYKNMSAQSADLPLARTRTCCQIQKTDISKFCHKQQQKTKSTQQLQEKNENKMQQWCL